MEPIITLQQKRLLRVEEAAQILNVSRWTVYRWVDDGRLGGTRIGVGSLRIFSHTVAALIDHHSVGVPDAVVLQSIRPSQKTPVQIGRQDLSRGRVRSRQA
ncbi:MAG: helix-turn-helix domain-containing protein [Nitrospira sp.]|nr:helix-turn-helix domain-containing protein [Nitrospira sp.]